MSRKRPSVLLVLLLAAGGGHLRLPPQAPPGARAHRHRHHQRRHRQPADRRADRPAARQGGRHGQAGPAASPSSRPTSCRPTARTTRTTPRACRRRCSEREAALRFQEQQTADQIHQAEATLASTEAQEEAAAADLENARLDLHAHAESVAQQGVVSRAGARSGAHRRHDAAQAKLDALKKQVEAQRAAVALARSNAEQVAVRRSQVQTQRAHAGRRGGAAARRPTCACAYTEIHAPIDGIVDVRAARAGEVVNPGQPIVTLINPDDLWVRADVEESYIDRVSIGDTLTVRLPSGAEREGTVFYRGVDAGVRDAARRQPHQARHQDVRDPAARATTAIAASPSA